ncbi:hypothetical protein [Pseudoxanthomonas japonensis]|uniref:hypothetical protein n=1 Tax=Pseudoxanthomonas japonensis TaxID=69284 RepID=UPI001390CCF6|nr:hypothetical protein [Pseudoxanthomonas japonensis]
MPTTSASDRRARGAAYFALALATLLSACGDRQEASSAAPGEAGGSPAPEAPSAALATAAGSATPSASPSATPPSTFGERQLDHPDDLQMLMLAYRLEGREPPIATWAGQQSRVAYADEFQRPALLQDEQGRLQAIYDGTAEVGRLRMNVRAHFGEYDSARGGYYLDAFMPGSVFHFTAQPSPSERAQRISLQVDNPEELNFWPLDAAAAQDVLTRNGGLRDVVLDSRLRITGINRRSEGPVITARLEGYAIGNDRYGRPVSLGERRFSPAGGP